MFHENHEEAIASILESPAAPKLVAQLQRTLESEQQRRSKFYQDIDDDVKAEFINGEIVVHSPVKKEHTDVGKMLLAMLDAFVQLAKIGYVGYEKVLSAFSRNDYEPDILFFENEKAADFSEGQWKYPVPDFVVEILSDSTEHRDRGIKFRDYENHGVQEYWIIDPIEKQVEQYLLKDGEFKLHLKSGQGKITSRVVVGFSIEIEAIFDEDLKNRTLFEMLKGHFS